MQKTGEWGQFFPINISPYGYNETIAQEYFPLTQKQAEKAGVKWKEENLANRYLGVKYDIPDDIRDVDDSLTSQILTCESCAGNYKVIKQELDFHKKHSLPVSKLCPTAGTKHVSQSVIPIHCLRGNAPNAGT